MVLNLVSCHDHWALPVYQQKYVFCVAATEMAEEKPVFLGFNFVQYIFCVSNDRSTIMADGM